MASFNLDNYVEVNVRIDKFWQENPKGRINTEIISFNDGVIVMKASIYKKAENESPDATGHAYEKEGSSFINNTSAVENCETSAVGRALGIMGYEIKKSVASKEEVANAKLQQEDIELKKLLVEKHKGDKAKAKAEYDKIKSGDKDITKELEYLEQKFGVEV